jgi:hypothetical protein
MSCRFDCWTLHRQEERVADWHTPMAALEELAPLT